MNALDIERVKTSFARVAPDAAGVAHDFYERLFRIAPNVRGLFRGDMQEQGVKLMLTLRAVVTGLNHLDALVPAAQDLARRHVGYGVEAEHYPVVGEALIETLRERLGGEFTPETEAAWAAAYGTLCDVMLAAAYPEVSGKSGS